MVRGICRSVVLLLSILMFAVLAGCGGSDNTHVQNPPAPPMSAVSIAFQPAPTSSISLAASASLTAVVNNDPSHAGVDWALLCQNNTNCGTLAPLHTASGAAATYTPPSAISGNSQAVTVEAFATADHSRNAIATINVTGFASSLKGTYVFETKGEDVDVALGTIQPFQLAGVIVLDGNGKVISGEQVHSDFVLSRSDLITGGSYFIGPDGRGTLTINTLDQNIGQLGVENLSLVVLSSSRALIATLDNPNLQSSSETSSGTLDLQTSTKSPAGGYAFAVSGTDISSGPLAIGGILNIDSANTISGTGSVVDEDDAGIVTPNATVSGTLTTPDSLGSMKFELTTGFPAVIQFTAFIVDATHIKLIESDNTGSGAGFGATSGVAIAQGAGTGKFTNNSFFAGNYVFEVLGEDLSALPTSLASIGQFTADTSGNLTNGFDDEILNGLVVGISDSFTGTYTLDATGMGRVDSTITFTSNGPGPELLFYLTGNGNPPLVLNADANVGSLGIGAAYLQAAPPFSFNGKYGVTFTQSSGPFENDATGGVTVDGTSNAITGVVDTTSASSSGFVVLPNTQINGTFSVIPSTGRFTGLLNNTLFPTVDSGTIPVAFYPVNPDLIFFIETDSLSSGELSLGYFAARSPVCPACQ